MPSGKSSLCPQQGVSTAEASGHRSYLPTINDSENTGHLNVSFREEVEYSVSDFNPGPHATVQMYANASASSVSDFNPTPHATVQTYVNANVSLGEGMEYLVPDFNPGPHATVQMYANASASSVSDFNPTPHATVQTYANADVSSGEGMEYSVSNFNPGPHAMV
jgi:hypothetical protein